MTAFSRLARFASVKVAATVLACTALVLVSFTALSGVSSAATTLSVTPGTITIAANHSAAFATTLNTSGFTGTPTITYVETTLSTGLTLNTATGVIRSTGALLAGNYTIGGTVSDTSGDTGSWSFTLNIQPTVSIVNPAVARTIQTGTLDEQVFTDGDYTWVANLVPGTVSEILESTGVVLHTISFSSTGSISPSGIASNGIDVWVTDFSGSNVVEFPIAQVNAQSSVAVASSSLTLTVTNTNTTTPPVGNAEPSDITYSGNYIWVTTQSGQALIQINATTGVVVQTISTAGDLVNPRGVSSDGTDVWVANPGYAFGGNNNNCATSGSTQWNNTISELNATTGALVRTVSVGNAYVAGSVSGSQPWDISADGTYTWVTLKCQNAVAKVNSSTGTVSAIIPLLVNSLPEGVVSDGTNVWIAESATNTVQELSASTNAIENTFQLASGASPWGITYDGTHVWVANASLGSVSEIVSTPELTPTTLPDGVVGTPYSQTLTASNGATGTYVIACNGTVPAGLTVTPNSTGVTITGTPTASGTFTNAVNCTVTDSTGVSSNDTIPITIIALPAITSPPTVVSGPPLVVALPPTNTTSTTATLNGTVNPNGAAVSNENFCYKEGTLLVDCAGATTLAINPPTLATSSTPTSLSALATGLTPGAPYCYQIEATNADGTTYSPSICVAAAGPSAVTGPIITTLFLPNASLHLGYSTRIATIDGTPPITFAATGLPSGLRIRSSNGVIYGFPSKLGTSTVTVTATDANHLTSTKVYTLKVVTLSDALPAKLRFITHFGENLYSLDHTDLVMIQQIADYVTTYGYINVALKGYTDPLDTKAYNLALGSRRGFAVQTQLRKDLKGLHNAAVHSTIASKGATAFVIAGLADKARASDRRVTVFVS